MTDIVDRCHDLADRTSDDVSEALWAAADEIERLRGELENVERDRKAQVEAERLRALVSEWAEADSANDFMADDTAVIRYARAMEALHKEANR